MYVLRCCQRIGFLAIALVAVSPAGKLLYARGFGWRDARHKAPTSMVHQRPDGYNIAVLCNYRREKTFEHDNHTLLKQMDKALDRVSKAKEK